MVGVRSARAAQEQLLRYLSKAWLETGALSLLLTFLDWSKSDGQGHLPLGKKTLPHQQAMADRQTEREERWSPNISSSIVPQKAWNGLDSLVWGSYTLEALDAVGGGACFLKGKQDAVTPQRRDPL